MRATELTMLSSFKRCHLQIQSLIGSKSIWSIKTTLFTWLLHQLRAAEHTSGYLTETRNFMQIIRQNSTTFDSYSDDGFRRGCRNLSQHQQQSFSGLHYKPGRSLKPQHWLNWVQTFHCYKVKYVLHITYILKCNTSPPLVICKLLFRGKIIAAICFHFYWCEPE